MFSMSFKTNAPQLKRQFDRLIRAGRDLRVPLMRIGLYVRREAQRLLRARPHDWGPSTTRLSRSLAVVADAMSVRVGSNLVYAAIQQVGGMVQPKTAKYLAIPILPHLRRAGIWPRDLPRDSMKFVPNASITIGSHSWTGPALVRREVSVLSEGAPSEGAPRKKPRGKAGEVMFALVRRVRITGRPYLGFDTPAQMFAIAELDKWFNRGFGRGGE